MRKSALICIILGLIFFPIWCGFSQEDKSSDEPWERVGVRAGGFLTFLNSSIRFGVTEGAGLSVDIEDTLGLSNTLTAFRVDSYWRFSYNRRHRFDLSYAAYLRSATREIQEDIPIGDDIIEAGTTVNSEYDIRVIKLFYSWSFLQDDRVDMGIGGGFYVMPLYIRISGEDTETKYQDITAPLPMFDFRMDFHVTPKTYFRLRVDAFYISIGGFTGAIFDYELAYEWKFSKHVGVGAGFESFSMRLQGKGDGTGLYQSSGEIQTEYNGLILYGKLYF